MADACVEMSRSIRFNLACAAVALAAWLYVPTSALADHPFAGGTAGHGGDPIAEFGGVNEPAETGSLRSAAFEAALPGYCPARDRGSDDKRNAVYPVGTPTIKVIYANPSDVPSRLNMYAPVIQAGAKGMADIVTDASAGALSLRLDVGNYFGPHCVDIQHVPLPRPSSAYVSSTQPFDLLANDVYQRLGSQSKPRDYLIYADNVPLGGVAGAAERCDGDGFAEPCHDKGELFAMLLGRGGTDFFISDVAFAAGETSRLHVEVALHEVSHNLGAVQDSSPNSSQAGHCRDEYDLMCYEDGGLPNFVDPNCDGANPPLDPYGPDFESWDCNKDDFFNVSPAPGSYLDTHWNVARSAFLCQIATCNPPDVMPPETDIRTAPKGRTSKRKITIAFDATELSSFVCQLDRRPAAPCSSPFRFKAKRGRHALHVVATDQAGNVETDPARVKFQVKKKRKKKGKKKKKKRK